LLSEYEDSGRSTSSVTGNDAGSCGWKGRPRTVSDEARQMLVMPRTRQASRTLYAWVMLVWKMTWLGC
jgi:hypothetical protein